MLATIVFICCPLISTARFTVTALHGLITNLLLDGVISCIYARVTPASLAFQKDIVNLTFMVQYPSKILGLRQQNCKSIATSELKVDKMHSCSIAPTRASRRVFNSNSVAALKDTTLRAGINAADVLTERVYGDPILKG